MKTIKNLLVACAVCSMTLWLPPEGRCGDIEAVLDSGDGSSSFVVYDASSNVRVRVKSDGSVISGGGGNSIGNGAISGVIGGGNVNDHGTGTRWSVIGGGYGNKIHDNTELGSISGGAYNKIGTNTYRCVIGGGQGNVISNNAQDCLIAGGSDNTVNSNAYRCVITGGGNNFVDSETHGGIIVGGWYNSIGVDADDSFIGGGTYNMVGTGTRSATIPGGSWNWGGGDYTFAAGRRAKANHSGVFAWGDSTDADFTSTAQNQFLVRAGGGVGINTNNPQAALHVNGDAIIGAQGPKFGMQAVSRITSGVLFQHPSGAMALYWNAGTYTLTASNSSDYYVDSSIHLTRANATPTNLLGRALDIPVGGTNSLSATASQAAGWQVTLINEGSAGPGLIFQGSGFNDIIGGLITYWY